MVAAMAETTAFTPILRRLHARMNSDVCGRRLLETRPRINNDTIDRVHLSTLPVGTLGREYERFLSDLHTEPNARTPVQFIDDPTLVYVMQRYRETHDMTHIVLAMPTNMLGEVTVKWFEAIQFGLPMCISGAMFGAMRLQTRHRQRFIDIYLPWIIDQALHARFFLAIDWENHWHRSLHELRHEFDIQPAPSV